MLRHDKSQPPISVGEASPVTSRFDRDSRETEGSSRTCPTPKAPEGRQVSREFGYF